MTSSNVENTRPPNKHLVVFQPSGRREYFSSSQTLLDAAKELGVPIESVCGGERWCAKCKVIIERGMENLSPLTLEEKQLLRDEELNSNYRLACCSEIRGDVVALVPEVSKAAVQVVRKPVREIPVKLDPAVKKYYVELKPPSLQDPLGDLDRLLEALRDSYGLDGLNIDYSVLRELPSTLREGNWKVTVTVWDSREIIRVEPGLVKEAYGLAVDIGTTTVVGYLLELSTGKLVSVYSMMNPQVPFGEDVMSRISYTIANPDGLEKLHSKILTGINLILLNTARDAGITYDDIYEIVLVGNTCMHHLFLKLDPQFLGRSPFPPTVHRAVNLKPRELGLNMWKAGNVHFLPVEAGFVGADNVGVLITVEPWKKSEVQLIIDIGTNGELVLGNNTRLLSASCATGPAFEGAHMKYGMRAAPGAIERVKIDPDSMEVEYETIEGEKARGICGSGIIEAMAEMFKAGVILKNGNINKDLRSPRLRQGEDGYEFILVPKEETAIGADIVVTQKDVRAIQLAKGAMYTGAKILMKHFGVRELDEVVLAGAFGSYIDREASMAIGLFPDCDLAKVKAVGNAAGDGARLALLSREKREEAYEVAKKVKYVELTVDPSFQSEFMKSMFFPHKEDPFPHLNHLWDNMPKQQGKV
ncbi:ASKHA domain-containing protein [Candidatus Hecatella orcuttiae]|jgi:uncharacterized 2Fe-2S/4Fe-4S cluster protein (DUF4445 family)|uniref:ASKHA domain-containing protein n=1 Tax=Candidatus Hecatella orcuttiae TaxID=1935119 RepID=UPI002867F240|nr:ASKHA domain-containing protein [Candidatus Hecatella orcuttiae]